MGAGGNRGHRRILALPQQVGGAYKVIDRERPQDRFGSWGCAGGHSIQEMQKGWEALGV